MQIIRLRLLAIAFLLALTPSASASQAIKANDVLLSAMSPFEDMIEFALAESDSDLSTTLAAADQHTTDSQESVVRFGRHRAATDKDHHEVARSAVEVFRLLIDNLRPKASRSPRSTPQPRGSPPLAR